MPVLDSAIQRDRTFAERAEHWRARVQELETEAARLRLGGGEASQAKQRSRGKLTARERIARLVDADSSFLELGLWSAWGQYREWGGAPAAGVVVGLGRITGRDAIVVANDATVKAGAWFPATCKKVLRAQEIALENRLPIVYLVDSAGVFLPLQAEIFADRDDFGRAFFNNARLSAAGVYQVAAILGSCVAGGAYLPIMSDESHIVEGSGSIFLAGAHLVKAAIGEEVDNQELGGAIVQADVSGVVDHRHPDEDSCLAKIRSQFSQLAETPGGGFARREPRAPAYPVEDLYGILPIERSRPYETRELLARLLDGSELEEFKAEYGKSLICGTGWIDGWAVGIVANQRSIVHRRTGTGEGDRELQIGGVLYSDSADKAARFVQLCNQKGLPLLFLQDVTGFMVGTRAERGGIIKDGAKLVNAVANSVVPKITLFVGNSFGAGNYALCGKAYGPRLVWCWPSATIAVMGADQATETLLAIELKNRGESGEDGRESPEQERAAALERVRARYQESSDPRYAASRLWVDGLIDPGKTREVLAHSLRVVTRQRDPREWKTGVLQT